MTTTNAEFEAMWQRQIAEAVDKCWKALIDLPIEQKGHRARPADQAGGDGRGHAS
jgi:hypothetical protein